MLALFVLALSGCFMERSDLSTMAQSSLKPLVKQTEEMLFIPTTSPTAPLNSPKHCQSPNKQVSEIVIGALLPLTESPAVQAGSAMKAAIEIAVRDINNSNESGAHPVRVVIRDTQGSPEIGNKKAEQLIVQDCAAALIGVYHSHVGMAVKDIAHKYGIPIIFAEPYNDAITADQYPEIFRIAPTRYLTAKAYIDWLYNVGDYNKDKEQTVVIIAEGSNFEASKGELIAQQLAEDEQVTVETILVDLPADDFSSMIARVIALEKSPDTILIWFNGEAGYTFHEQLIEAGIGPKNSTLVVLRHSAINSDLFWERVPDGIYTVVTKIGPWHSTVSDMGKAFAHSYKQHVNRWPESYAFEAYDATRLIASAIAEAGTLDAPTIIETLESIDIVLASGRYHFPYGSKNIPDGEDIPTFMWHQWPDPHILFLQYSTEDQSAEDMPVLWPENYRTVDISAFYTTKD